MKKRHRKGSRLPGSSRRVEELLLVAIRQLPVVHFPPPSSEQAAALRTASKYLHQTGTQVASFLLGFPPLDPDTAALAEFSTLMLRSAALCDGLRELADDLDRE